MTHIGAGSGCCCREETLHLCFHRQGRSVLYLLESETRLDRGNSRNFGDMLHQESFKLADIGYNDSQQVVGIARHEIAFHDLWSASHSFFESLKTGLIFLFETDLDEDANAEPKAKRIKESNVSADVALLFERTDPSQARGRRETDAAGKCHIRQPGVLLQEVEDSSVGTGERVWHRIA
jgi:hypothetical protein